jgi:hypothetical protein
MAKLLMLKEWLTLDEAAVRLSATAGEPVTESDLLRLAIENHLQLSVFIDSNVIVRDVEFEVEEVDGQKCFILGDGAKEPSRIDGLWDLAAYGVGMSEMERLFRELKGLKPGARIGHSSMGLYLHDEEKTMMLEVLKLELKFLNKAKTGESESDSPAPEHTGKRTKTDPALAKEINDLLMRGLGDHGPVIDEKLVSYYRERSFPEQCLIVLRRDELLSFEGRHLGVGIKAELTPTERESSHQIMAAMAAMAKLDLSAPYKAVGILRKAAELQGLMLPASDETIVKFLGGPARKKR